MPLKYNIQNIDNKLFDCCLNELYPTTTPTPTVTPTPTSASNIPSQTLNVSNLMSIPMSCGTQICPYFGTCTYNLSINISSNMNKVLVSWFTNMAWQEETLSGFGSNYNKTLLRTISANIPPQNTFPFNPNSQNIILYVKTLDGNTIISRTVTIYGYTCVYT